MARWDKQTPSERFWEKVVPADDGCMVWTGSRDPRGYGRVWRSGRLESAHRVAWQECVGPIPEGMFVCHRCDNPPCCNPSHLFLGTNRENMHDALRKGRLNPAMFDGTMPRIGGQARAAKHTLQGEGHPHHRLTERDVRDIRALAASGRTQASIAPAFGISRTRVGEIVRREAWTHVE